MGYRYKCADDLVNQLTAAYYNAYWNGANKSKKSLNSVVRSIYRGIDKDFNKAAPKIDKAVVKKDFERMEALKTYGWYKE